MSQKVLAQVTPTSFFTWSNSASDRGKVDTKTFNPTPPPYPPPLSVYLDSIFFRLCMWRNSAVTYVLTSLKNNVVATGASKKLVATVLGWNQSLTAAMYL